MGNYFGNSFYKYSGCIPENNNFTMNAVALPCRSKTAVIKQTSSAQNLSRFISLTEITSEVSIKNLQIENQNNNTFMFKTLMKRLIVPPYFSKDVPGANMTSEGKWRKSNLKYHDESSIDTDSQSAGDDSDSDSILDSNTYSYFSNSRQEVDPDSLILTASINMVESQRSVNSEQEVPGTRKDSEVKYRGGISFFVDLKEPEERYPLDAEYKFTFYNDCHSISSEGSLYSPECCDDAGSSTSEENFVVFTEQEIDEESTFCGFQVTPKEYTPENTLTCLKNESLPKCLNTVNSTHLMQGYNCTSLVSCETTSTKGEQTKISEIASKTSRKVRFKTGNDLVVIYQMKYWDFAYRQARKGPWEVAAADRCRFWRRIKDLELVISPCLQRKLQSIKK